MPRISYVARSFRPETLRVIAQANAICEDYTAQGFVLTLRQLYYQFVARGLIRNQDREYKRLGTIVNDARLAGLMDWMHLEDRTRELRSLAHWSEPRHILQSAAASYRIDKWACQPYRPEVWIEKDALLGVIEGICEANDVPYFSCRGYTSQSEIWGASQRLLGYRRAGQTPVILHLGDHDPSGIDMSRDIAARLALFIGQEVDLQRLALTMEQVQRYQPPPNPAKQTDSRFANYTRLHGDESWELDALEPSVIANLIQGNLDRLIDSAAWEQEQQAETQQKALLRAVHDRWSEVKALVGPELGESTSGDVLRGGSDGG
jgi:hypothetical protein